LPNDAAQMTFHHESNQPFALRRGLRQKLLGSSQYRLLIRTYLNLRNGFDSDCYALLGIEILLRSHIKRHQLQRKLTAVLDHRKDNCAVALDYARTAKSIDNERLVRARFAKHLGQ